VYKRQTLTALFNTSANQGFLKLPSKASIKGFGESFSKEVLLLPAVFLGLWNRMGKWWVIQQPLFGLRV